MSNTTTNHYTPDMFRADLGSLQCLTTVIESLGEHSCCVAGCTEPPLGLAVATGDIFALAPICKKHEGANPEVPMFNLDADDARALVAQAFRALVSILVEGGSLPFYSRTPAAICGVLNSSRGVLFMELDGVPGALNFVVPFKEGDPLFVKHPDVAMFAKQIASGKSFAMMGANEQGVFSLEIDKSDFVPIPAMKGDAL